MRLIGLVLMLLVFSGCQGTSTTAKEDRARLDQIADIYTRGDYAKAITELETYLSKFPQDSLAWTILGHAYKEVDNLDKAKSAYDSALQVNPRQFEAITGLGILHRKLGDYEAAMKAYEKAVEIDPKYAQAYSSMTTIALKKHEDKKALEYAQKGYELDKTDPVIAANLAIAYHYNDDTANREKFTQIAKQLGYRNMEALKQIYSGVMTIRD